MSGWIKIHRSMLEWEWYDDTNTKVLFFHILLKANHKPKKWRGLTIERGQIWTSLDTLSDEIGLSKQQVRTCLDKLSSTGELTHKGHSTGRLRGRMITVVQYEKYQEDGTQTTGGVTASQHTSNIQSTATKECKNEKNVRSKDKHFDQNEFDRLFEKFWSAGLVKKSKKVALKKFTSICKQKSDPEAFTDRLINDVRQRLAVCQTGFTELHPTTYLNGERWNDDITQPTQITKPQSGQKRTSAVDRVKQNVAERQRARSSANGPSGEPCGQALAADGGDVRVQVHEPVRGSAGRDMGEVLEGDFWSADG